MPTLTTQTETLIAEQRAAFEADCAKLLEAAKAADAAIESGDVKQIECAVLALNCAEYELTRDRYVFTRVTADVTDVEGI
jgi:hypothetical protein